MGEPRVETLDSAPGLAPIFVRAALSRTRRLDDAIPPRVLRLEGQRIDRDHLTAYQRLCGFTADDRLPHTYPHVLGFGLQATLLGDPAFPLPMVGLVHVENEITVYRALTADDLLEITVHADNLAPHAKGRTVQLVTEVDVDGARVWEGRSTYLARGKGETDAPSGDRPPAMPSGFPAAQWSLAADLGREYAAVSGDVNPIHLSALTAKATGFPQAIAHGMWSYARVMAALGRHASGPVTSHVWFRKPILLPSRVDLVVDTTAIPNVAGLRSARRPDVEHLVLTVS